MSDRTEQHVVIITKSLGEERRDELIAYINAHLAEFKGKTEDKRSGRHGLLLMVFERQQDAHLFANAISKALDFPREHIEVKPRGHQFSLNRDDVIRH